MKNFLYIPGSLWYTILCPNARLRGVSRFLFDRKLLVSYQIKMVLTPADCPFGAGDGVYESACRDAAKPLSCGLHLVPAAGNIG